MAEEEQQHNRGRRVNDSRHNEDKARLGHLEREMGGIKGEVGLLKVAMTENSAKLTGVMEQMGAIARSLEKLGDRVHEPKNFNWGWLISAVMGVILIGGLHAGLITQPIKMQSERNYKLISDLEVEVRTLDRRLAYREGLVDRASKGDE